MELKEWYLRFRVDRAVNKSARCYWDINIDWAWLKDWRKYNTHYPATKRNCTIKQTKTLASIYYQERFKLVSTINHFSPYSKGRTGMGLVLSFSGPPAKKWPVCEQLLPPFLVRAPNHLHKPTTPDVNRVSFPSLFVQRAQLSTS